MNKFLQYSIILFIGLLPYYGSAQLSKSNGAIKGAVRIEDHIQVCKYSNEVRMARVPNKNPKFKEFKEAYLAHPLNARSFPDNLKTSEIIINFGPGMQADAGAMSAFRFAADLWELELVSSVPIVIDVDYAPLQGGTIASTGSVQITNVPGGLDPSISYNSSTANSIAGVDLVPGSSDMFMTFNSNQSFYFGLDQNTPSGEFDFVTITFHEIGHGMGILGNSGFDCDGVGRNNGVNPNLWDILSITGDGTPVVDLGYGSQAQRDALTSNNLFMSGFNALKALEGTGQPAKIFVPSGCSPGSTFAHWDENTFNQGDPNSLMSPFANLGESIHDIGDLTRGYLKDIGWRLSTEREFDLGLANIVRPMSSGTFTATEEVKVSIGNLGNTAVSAFIVSYKVDDGDWVSEEFNVALNPDQEEEVTFAQRVDLTANASYTITAKIEYFIDEFKENDIATKVVIVEDNTVVPISFPYAESWEDGVADWTSSGLWALGAPAGTVINSASDGANAWVTNLSGNYPDQNTAFLTSPTFNFTGYQNPIIEMDIWYDIETGWDGAAFQVSLDNGASWATVGELGDPDNWYTDGPARAATAAEGDDGVDALTAAVSNGNGWTGTAGAGSNGWITARHQVNLFDEDKVVFRLVFASDQASNNEGFAVDNIRISPNNIFDNDIGVTEIVSPESGNLDVSQRVRINIQNFGREDKSNFDVSFTVDGGSPIIETVAETVSSDSEIEYTFSASADLSNFKVYTISASTNLVGDERVENNETVKLVENILTVQDYPYSESFENGNGNWKSGGLNSSWELGLPSNTIINSASDGTQAWVTSLSGDYNNDEASYLESPGFDFTGFTEPVIGFDIWFEEEPLTDGVFLQYSTDNGITWLTAGTTSDAGNWYNRSSLATSEFDDDAVGWNWKSGGYWTSLIGIGSLSNESFVIFRFVFASNSSNTYEGVAVDLVRVFDKSSIDFSIACLETSESNNDSGLSLANINLQNPTVVPGTPANDPIKIFNNFNLSNDPADDYPIGETLVTFVVDVDGLLDICTTTVIVSDIEKPTINCPEDVLVALEDGQTEVTVNYEVPTATDNFGFSRQVSYSNGQMPDGSSGIACPTGPNAYLRAFDLIDDFDISDELIVQSVDIGIQSVEVAQGVSAQVNIYSFDQEIFDVNDPLEFIYDNMELLESVEVLIPDNADGTIMNIPVSTLVPAGMIAIVELFTQAPGEQLFIGANPDQTGDSYLVAAACGSVNPSNVIDEGFSDSQWVMSLNGLVKTSDEVILLSGIGSGNSFSLGNNIESWSINDANGLTGDCLFNVDVVTAEFDTPTATDATSISTTGFVANWNVVAGASFYQLFVFEWPSNEAVPAYDGVISSTTQFTLTGLEPNTAYGYSVRVVDDPSPGKYSTQSIVVVTTTIISQPDGLTAKNIGGSSFQLSWNKVSKISNYSVDVSTDNFTSFVGIYEGLLVDQNDSKIEGLMPNLAHQVRVRAINDGGASVNSSVLIVSTLPASPKAVGGSAINESSFMANWEMSPSATIYELDVSSDAFVTFILQDVLVSGTSYEVNGLNPNTNYMYRVRAKSTEGELSNNSNTIRTTTFAIAPVVLLPIDFSSYGFEALWDPSINTTTYELDVSTDNFSTFLDGFEKRIVNSTSQLVLNLNSNTTYFYKVRAVNSLGVLSGNSNSVEFTTPSNSTQAPMVPIATAATNISSDAFTANWSGVNALFFELDVSGDGFSTNLPAFDRLKVFGNSISIIGLDVGTNYEYRLRAFNNDGFSEFSNSVMAQTVLGFENLIKLEGMVIYPNPTRDYLILKINNDQQGIYSIKLIDEVGRVIEDFSLVKETDEILHTFDLKILSRGIYYLLVQNGSSFEANRIVKE